MALYFHKELWDKEKALQIRDKHDWALRFEVEQNWGERSKEERDLKNKTKLEENIGDKAGNKLNDQRHQLLACYRHKL